MINQALHYLSIGFSVIPLRPFGKEPLIPWTEFQKRRATEQEVKEWFQKWPIANIGLITGALSGVVVVDLDGQEGLDSASRLGLESSVVSLTGNGKHLWFRVPLNAPLIENSVKKIAPGIDIRGEGGYVVAPGSIHESGRRYRFLNAIMDVAKLPVFPTELIKSSVSGIDNGLKQTELTDNYTKKEEGWIAKALEEMKYGNIDNTLTAILGRMRHDGYSAGDARGLLTPHARKAGAEEGHLEEKIENIWNRYPAGTGNGQRRMDMGQSWTKQPKSAYDYSGTGIQSGIVIHSPTNPDSFEQYELHMATRDTSTTGATITGFAKLDEMLEGGIKSERPFVVAALTNHGKTNFAISLSRNLCEQGKKVLYFSTEFSYKKIWDRYIAALADPSKFRGHAFNVCDGFTPNIEQIEEAIIQIKPDIFIFDFIQHLSKDKDVLKEFMKGCQWMQRKYGVQAVILAQLNRHADWVENGKRILPRMSMIEGSASIEQGASRVLLLSQTQITPEYNEITGVLDKNDAGDLGMIQFALYKKPYHLEQL